MYVRDLACVFETLSRQAALFGDELSAEKLGLLGRSLKKQKKNLRVKEALDFWQRVGSKETDSIRCETMSARKVADHLRLVADNAEPLARKNATSPLRELVSFLRERGEVDALSVVDERVRPLPQKDWLAELKAASVNRAAFEAAVQGLKSDRAVTLVELNKIVEGYSGLSRKAKTKKEAVERLYDQFEADVQYRSKVELIDRMTGNR